MKPHEIDAERLARDFWTTPPAWRLWMLIVGAGLKCGALTEAEAMASAEASDDPLERAQWLLDHTSPEQTAMIRAEFAKVSMLMPGEGHA